MKKTFAIAALVFSTGAFAAQTNTGCQGNCPTGDSITNQGGIGYGGNGGNATAGAVGIAIAGGGTGGSGGAGGAGGAGGSVVGSGNSSATGGAVVGSGNSTQGQQQGQNQGQNQVAKGGNANQAQSSRNDNRSSASNQNSNANSGNNAQTSVSVQGDTVTYQAPKIPVATAYAAGLTASNGTCMGSTSAGVQGMSVGVSIGSTWKDSGCDRRYNAQALAAVGQAKAAVALLCQDADIAAAMATAGTPCTKIEVKSVASTQEAEVAAIAKSEPLDPLVRSRLNLPPLK